MRQGSVLPPYMFKIFINDLLVDINEPTGIMIGKNKINSFAYVDDIKLLQFTTQGLQQLIEKYGMYSKEWRFNFGLNKTKCMIVGKNNFREIPVWFDNRKCR